MRSHLHSYAYKLFYVIVPAEDSEIKTLLDQTLDGNVLIVDDEVSVGRFIGELLKGCGCRVTVETNSQSALLRFKDNPEAFDLVVTDQTMPGVELAQSLLEIRSEFPVVLCTGYSDHIDEAKARSLGIRGYVNKPIENDEFLRLVGEGVRKAMTGHGDINRAVQGRCCSRSLNATLTAPGS